MKKLIIGLMISIVLVSMILVSTYADETLIINGQQTTLQEYNSIQRFFYSLFGQPEQFSIIGVNRHCSSTPDNEQNIHQTTSINRDCVDGGCSGDCLIDLFKTDSTFSQYNPYKEYKNSISLSSPNYYIAQYYCCPYPECTSDADCQEWYNSASKCLTSTTTDQNIPYRESSWKFCSNTGVIDCYYYPGSGSTCLKVPQSSCSGTYMSHNLFGTQINCENSISNPSCTNPNNWVSSSAECCGTKPYACSSSSPYPKACKATQAECGTCRVTGGTCSQDSDCCQDSIQNTCTNGICKSNSNPTCTPSWTCSDWGICNSNTNLMYRTCSDSQSCGTTVGKPETQQACGSNNTNTCTPDWSCVNGTAIDANNCGETYNGVACSTGNFDINAEVFKLGTFSVTWLMLIIGVVVIFVIAMLSGGKR